jgi:exonuclease SbcC
MKLHRLSMTAFGPFAGTEAVDFDDLAESGLYLIHGPTGGGKTSILDAICFALYAAVPGSRSGSRGTLRSDHAAADAVPQVQLELTVGGRRMRITRSPAFSRPKKRGAGETTVQATVLLQELVDGEWITKGTRLDEVAQVIDDVVGLGLEQFVKVVLLPQGEFAAFLRATPEERRGLLERLFDTSRFTDVEDWFAARRRDSAARVEASRTALRTGLQRVDDVLSDLDPLGPLGAVDRPAPASVADSGPAPENSESAAEVAPDSAPGDGDVALPWSELGVSDIGPQLVATVSRVADLAGVALARAEDAAGGRDRATARLADAKRTSELQARARLAQDTLTAVGELMGQRDANAQTLERARRARELAAHLSGLDHAAAEAARSDERVKSARAEVARVCRALADPDDDTNLPTVRLLAEEVTAAAPALARAGGTLDRARASRSRADEQASLAGQHQSELDHLHQVARQHDERRQILTAQFEALTTAASQLERHRARHAGLRRALKLAESRAEAADRIARLGADEDATRGTAVGDGEEVVRLHRLHIEGMAGELAQGLVDGQDCPVCGSVDHPRPAATTTQVTSDQIEAAEQRAKASRAAHDEVRQELASVRARHDTQTDELATCLDELDRTSDPALEPSVPDAVRDPRGVMVERLQELAGAAGRDAVQAHEAGLARDDAEQQLRALEQSIEQTVASRQEAETALATAAATRDAARTEATTALEELARLVSEHQHECPCADPTLAPAAVTPEQSPAAVSEEALHGIAARHRAATTRLDELVAALQDLTSVHRALTRARDELQTALTEHGFPDTEAARTSSRSDDQMAALERELRGFDRRRETAQAVLAEPEVVAAVGQDEPDLEALTELEHAARESHTVADRTADHYGRAERRLRQLSREIHTALEHLVDHEAQHRTLQDLADCVAGTGPDNELKMRLSAFVLAARLEEVARYANERLGVMSDGRYSLRHSDARAARGARSGLGLRVVDAWTGIERETSTLSGGEAFLASLALALGLGDAVRAEAGGLDLQTLFVDEGFGSLDDESLEHVMGILDDLREGGRSVGIVSHVAELRQRIRCQILVHKTPAGSHLAVRTALADEPAA